MAVRESPKADYRSTIVQVFTSFLRPEYGCPLTKMRLTRYLCEPVLVHRRQRGLTSIVLAAPIPNGTVLVSLFIILLVRFLAGPFELFRRCPYLIRRKAPSFMKHSPRVLRRTLRESITIEPCTTSQCCLMSNVRLSDAPFLGGIVSIVCLRHIPVAFGAHFTTLSCKCKREKSFCVQGVISGLSVELLPPPRRKALLSLALQDLCKGSRERGAQSKIAGHAVRRCPDYRGSWC